jgi:3-oxoacyl-ACP reductase-like protein
MGLFNNIMSAIFGHPAAAASPSSAPSKNVPNPATTTTPSTTSAGTAAPANPSTPQANVDVSVVLNELASKNSEQLDWKKSIVDLMKLVGMDSSLASRKELAKELGFNGDSSDSATMNVWLHKQVLRKLVENGGKVPAELLD